MNDLGLTLAWSALQVSLLMIPAVALHALALRRSAASGSWMAALGLALGLVITIAALIPWPRGVVESPAPGVAGRGGDGESRRDRDRGRSPRCEPLNGDWPARRRVSLSFAAIRGVLSRLERGTSVPLDRVRPWGRAVAAVGITGAAIGLFRLFLGLWAVGLCRRRGTIISDPNLIDLLDELQAGMGFHQLVEICQVPELVTPATAGWRHPVILLPDDWRSWDDATRRAVLLTSWPTSSGGTTRRASWPGWRWRFTSITRWSGGWLAGSSCSRSWRPTRWGPGSRGAEPVLAGSLAAGAAAGRTVPMLAGEGVPPGAGDLDQEDRHVA